MGLLVKVSPDWSQKTMTCHSFNCFSIVWGQLLTSHPSSCYMTLMSEQGRVTICKYSQSPFNQFSFSMLSLFLCLKTGLNYTRKVVDQRRILNPEFEQLFDACCHSCQLSTYQYLQQQCSNSQVHCTSPLQTMKRK